MKNTKEKTVKIGMTKQWACDLCGFPENFGYECSLCGVRNDKAKPDGYQSEIPESAYRKGHNL